MMDDKLRALEARLGLTFRQPDLLLEALTHPSYLNENTSHVRDNERLEFLGDSVVDFLVTDRLYHLYPDRHEGQLTELRASLVRAESFFILAKVWQLETYLRTGRNEISALTTDTRAAVMMLSRAFEAVVGAVYLDQGWAVTESLLWPLLQERLSQVLAQSLYDKDVRNVFQERFQAQYHVTPHTRTTILGTTEQDRRYRVELVVAEIVLGVGEGLSKQLAARAAAQDALERWEREGLPKAVMGLGAPQKPPAPRAPSRVRRPSDRDSDDGP